MSLICKSANFLWKTDQFLGKGATGMVYEGLHRMTGRRVAVKTFEQLNRQNKEFEMLQKVDHVNIIRLLAQENEETSRIPVIIMELCTGGSLRDILDLPENAYGLEEEEFLLFLEHLTAGMKYLRDINIIHRDIKPGNILRFEGENGNSIYKLTDFDTARELQDDQKFTTICGTPAYLHPEVLRPYIPVNKQSRSIQASVDLWSIGVTIYHSITGELPFRIKWKSTEDTYNILSKKKSGVIAGVQDTENGDIQWSSELPDTSRLSQGLKDLVTPILGCLLELDENKSLTFDSFFKEVTNILSKVKFHIFFLNLSSFLNIYIDSHEHFDKFQDLITKQTKIEPQNQCILFDSQIFEVEPLVVVSEYPKTKLNKPFILLCKSSSDISIASIDGIPEFPNLDSQLSLDRCIQEFKSALNIAFYYKRRVEEFSSSQLFFHESVKSIMNTLHKKIDHASKSLGYSMEKWNFLSTFLIFWNSNSSSLHKIFDLFMQYVEGLKGYKNKLKSSLEDKQNKHDDFSKSLSKLEIKLKEVTIKAKSPEIASWDSYVGCLLEENCKERVTIIINDMKAIYKHYELKKICNVEISDLDVLEQVRFKYNICKINDTLRKHCYSNSLKVHSKFHKWYDANDGPRILCLEVESLIKEIATIQDDINYFSKSVQEDWQEYETIFKDLAALIGNESLSSNLSLCNVTEESSKILSKTVKGKFKHDLKELSKMLANAWQIMDEDKTVLKDFFTVPASDVQS